MQSVFKVSDVVRDKNAADSQWVRILEIRDDEARVQQIGGNKDEYIVWTGCLSFNAYR